MVLIAFAGLWRSTFLACLSIPVGFSIPLLISPLVPWAIFGTRCVGGCLLIAYLVCNIVSVTRGRRRGFMLERSFQVGTRGWQCLCVCVLCTTRGPGAAIICWEGETRDGEGHPRGWGGGLDRLLPERGAETELQLCLPSHRLHSLMGFKHLFRVSVE